MSHHDLDRMTAFFAKYGSIAVLIARLLPVVRTFIAFPAGIAKMPQLRFHIYTFVGSWPWCFGLAYVGMKLGEAWHTDPRFHQAFHQFHFVVEVVLVVGIVWFVWSHLNRDSRSKFAARRTLLRRLKYEFGRNGNQQSKEGYKSNGN
jgi:membrane protein DedA with SNARE-associated domain